MRSLSFILFFATVLFAANCTFGQQPQAPDITVQTDRDQIVAGEPFNLIISVKASGQVDPEIQVPLFAGFEVLGRRESHPMSMSFSFGTGQKTTRYSERRSDYQFKLIADKPGKYRLDPVVVIVGNKKYQGQSFKIEVLPGSGSSSTGQALQPMPGGEPTVQDYQSPTMDAGDLSNTNIDKDFFIQTQVSTDDVVVGEGLVMSVYLYTSKSIADPEIVREPGTEGFLGENLLSRRPQGSTVVEIEGRQYRRILLRKQVLFPFKTGTLTIAPPVINVLVPKRVGVFRTSYKKYKRSSKPIRVQVSPLPAEGQPPGFNPANVGHFSFRTNVDNKKIKIGEPVTFKMTAKGQGNIRNIMLPELEEVEGFKVYPPELDKSVTASGNSVTGTRTSSTLLIAEASGVYEIPSVSWSYFDTQSKTYITLKSPKQKITVLNGKAATEASKKELDGTDAPIKLSDSEKLNQQMRSITTRANLSVGNGDFLAAKPWFMGLAIVTPFAYLMLLFILRTRYNIATGKDKNRSKRADSKALRKLSKIEPETDSFFAELQNVLTAFLEDRLEVPVAGDTTAELRTRLIKRGFNNEMAERVVTEMEACEFARFARSADDLSEQRSALSKMQNLIKEMAGIPVGAPTKEEK